MRAPAAVAAGLLAVAAVALAASPSSACACGIAVQASVTQERALVVALPGREELIVSFDLERDGAQPAVVLPVPGDPTVEAVQGGDPLAYLDRVTTLTRSAPGAGGGEDGATAGANPVDVIGRETVGGYDVTRLRADDPAALATWLQTHRYDTPAATAAPLADYVAEGWRYVAIRLAPRTQGRLKPLRISFPTDRPTYPLRLSRLASGPVALTLYVLSDGPMAVDGASGLETVFSGRIGDLPAPPPEGLADLLPADAVLTKVTAPSLEPSEITGDLIARRVPEASTAFGDHSASAGTAGALNDSAAALSRVT